MKDLLTQAQERLQSPRTIPAAALIAVVVGVVFVPSAFAELALALCLIGWVAGGLVGLVATRRSSWRVREPAPRPGGASVRGLLEAAVGLIAARRAAKPLPERGLRRQGPDVWGLLGAATGLAVALLCVGYTASPWLLKGALAAFLLRLVPLPRAFRKNDGWDHIRVLPTVLAPLRRPLLVLVVLMVAGASVVGIGFALRPVLGVSFVGYPVAGAGLGLWVGTAASLWVIGRRARAHEGSLWLRWAPSAAVICWVMVALGLAAGHLARRFGLVVPGAWMVVLGCLAAPGVWLLAHPRHRRIAADVIRRRPTEGTDRLALPVIATGALGGSWAAAAAGAAPVATVLLYSVAVVVWLLFWTTPDLIFGVRTTAPAESKTAELSPHGRSWARTTGSLAGLNTAVMLVPPLIAFGRAESDDHAKMLLLFAPATMAVGFLGLLVSRVGGGAVPRKIVAVATVAVAAVAFLIDRVFESDLTFVIAFGVSGLVIPLLSTLGNHSASRFPSFEDEYHARRQQVAARVSAVAVCLPLLQEVGLEQWVSLLLALAFAVQAAAIARLKWFETTHSSGVLARVIGNFAPLRTGFQSYIDKAPTSAGPGGWRDRRFWVFMTAFFIGQLLGTATGTAVTTVMKGAGFAAIMALWLPLSRLVASTSFWTAGKLRGDGQKAGGIVRAGVLFVLGGIAFWLTGLVEETPFVVAAAVALFALTMGLNVLLVVARALVSRHVPGSTPMVDLGWTGTLAGWIGGQIIPLVLPPGASGGGTNVVALGVIGLGFAAVVLARVLRRVLDIRTQ